MGKLRHGEFAPLPAPPSPRAFPRDAKRLLGILPMGVGTLWAGSGSKPSGAASRNELIPRVVPGPPPSAALGDEPEWGQQGRHPLPKRKKEKKGCQGAVPYCQRDLGGRRRWHGEADAISVVTVPRGSGGRRHRGRSLQIAVPSAVRPPLQPATATTVTRPAR